MRKLKHFIVVFLSSACSVLNAQTDFSDSTWLLIDTSISRQRNLTDIAELVESLKTKALAEKKYFHAARCYNYLLEITDRKTEDTFYFKNSAFIDEMLVQKQQPFEMLLALHMMQAYRLAGFKNKYKKYQQIKYERNDIPINYAAFTWIETDSMAMLHLEKAKEISKQLKDISADEALWLSSDPLQFLFKPALYDIVIAQQIMFAANSRYLFNDYQRDFLKSWVGLSMEDFSTKLDSLSHFGNKFFKQLGLYGEWMNYRKADPSTYYFIESLARKSVYNRFGTEFKDLEEIYENYLQEISGSVYAPVKAHGVYQLCLLWNGQSQNYFPISESPYDHRGEYRYPRKYFDTTYRYHAVKALDLFKANQVLLDSFSYLKNILLAMEAKIMRTELNFSLLNNNLPGEPILAELKFKNADTIYYRIAKLRSIVMNNYTSPAQLIELLTKPVIKQSAVDLPATNDHNYHNSYLNIGELQPGDYVLLYSNKQAMDTLTRPEYVFFNVTNLSIIHNDKRVYVLNRKTGKPLAGAKVVAVYSNFLSGDARNVRSEKNYTANNSGYIELQDRKHTQLTVYYGNDTTYESVELREYNRQPDDVYSKEDYEDLVEFYEDNTTAYIYTDRSIYRPGQTVFYKAIFITKNKDTGEPMIMSKKNLEGKLFNSVYKKWQRKEEPLMFITDPFGREVDTIKIKPNEYGSVSGSFKIPKTAATGGWTIDPDYIDRDYHTGSFLVEEYKRPSYEINIEKPKKELLPGDKLSFKVKVRSFAGAALGNVEVNYTVSRRRQLSFFESGGVKDLPELLDETIVDTTGYTNNGGELDIEVDDSILRKFKLDKNKEWEFVYNIDAEAVDATGESYENEASITVSSQPIRIKFPLSNKNERSDLKPVTITAEDDNAGVVTKNIGIRVYRVIKDDKIYSDRKLLATDLWVHDSVELQKQFPYEKILQAEGAERKELVLEKNITTGEKEKLVLDENIFTAGNYEIEAVCMINDTLRGKLERDFSVFDEKEKKMPGRTLSFSHLSFNSANPGDTVKYYFGNSEDEIYSIFHTAYFAGKKKIAIKNIYNEQQSSKGLHSYMLKVPNDAVDRIELTQVYVFNNQSFKHTERINVSNIVEDEPEIIVEKYRKKLSPGSKETFSVSIKTKNENIAAELMTTMYDASLDKLEDHKWEEPRERRSFGYLDVDWTENINYISRRKDYVYPYGELALIQPGHISSAKPLWWYDNFFDLDVMADFSGIPLSERSRRSAFYANAITYDPYDVDVAYSFSGRAAGMSLASTRGLDEVVVVGYGSVIGKKKNLAGSVSAIRVRGMGLSSSVQPLIILDGEVFTGDLSKIDPNTITEGLILKGADASAIYGSKAANGVLVLSTKGKIIFPNEPEPVIIPRKNFNESAFFFPAIHADKNGYYSFDFTMPESVTEWNWKMLATTKSATFAYAERNLNTQLPLMVQPNMPRLLYQGDRIILQNRITNLDSTDASGKIVCKIEDAVTGNDITALVVTAAQKNFSVNKKSNIAEAFEIKIPQQQLNPIKIIITVRSENFADGEEHIIPILSPAIFVRESIPFNIVDRTDSSIQIPALPADTKFFGLGLGIPPKPQSALINSLPYLANYPYGCTEQTFNKLFAYMTALKLMRSDSSARLSFDKAKRFVEKNDNTIVEKLPDVPFEETMPWLSISNKESLMQKQLFNLFDTSKTVNVIEELLDKIYKSQNPDGGLTWFSGGQSSFYISNYVLRGFGSNFNDDPYISSSAFKNEYTSFIQKLVSYVDGGFEKQQAKEWRSSPVYYIYARCYWLKKYPLNDSLISKAKKYLTEEWKNPVKRSLYGQALLIIASLRISGDKQDELYKNAVQQLGSIRQLAIEDEQNGLRWKALADEDDLSNSSEETIALLAEAFKEADKETNIQEGIIKWLLTAKNDHSWRNTKATAAAIDLIRKRNKTVTGTTQTLSAKFNQQNMTVTDDLLSGHGFSFVQTDQQPATINLQKQSSTPAAGNLSWYYFTSSGELSKLNKDIIITKAYSRWHEEEHRWEALTGGETLKISDKIKVVVTIRTSKNLQYVFVDDKRAAAFEPVDNSSGYEYTSGINYYKSVRDAGFQFFSDLITAGNHEISYELKVVHEGSFICSPAVLQCMYKPELVAYSNSTKFVCEK